MISQNYESSLRSVIACGRMLTPASIFSPVGNFIFRLTSYGVSKVSLQWIRVSSKSSTIVYLTEHNYKTTFFRFMMMQSDRVLFQLLQRRLPHIQHEIKCLQWLDQMLAINHEVTVFQWKRQVSDIVVHFGLLVLVKMVVPLEHLWVLLDLGYELVHDLLLVRVLVWRVLLVFGCAVVLSLGLGLFGYLGRVTAQHVLVAVWLFQHFTRWARWALLRHQLFTLETLHHLACFPDLARALFL